MTSARELAGRVITSQPKQVAAASPRMVKYTLLMTVDDADALDQLMLRVRRTTGRRVAKSQLIRGLLQAVLSDATLLEQIQTDEGVREAGGPLDRLGGRTRGK